MIQYTNACVGSFIWDFTNAAVAKQEVEREWYKLEEGDGWTVLSTRFCLHNKSKGSTEILK